MTEQLKKRLIGVSVLVALAAIFVPMLFDDSSDEGMPTFGSNVPPKPDANLPTIEIPLQLPPPEDVQNRVITSEQEAAAYEAMAPEAPAPEPVAPEAVAAAPTLATAPPVSAPPPVTASRGNTAATKPAATTHAGAAGPQSWAVQLGSFGKSDNALALRDKARAKGFSAYVEQVKGANGVSYRVRIGPELKRENADALKQKVAARLGVNAVVMPHP